MNVAYDNARTGIPSSSHIQADSIVFTSLCAAFSNLDPVVPPVLRRHSSRWRIFLSVIIGVMTLGASLAHLRYMMYHGTDRRVQERINVFQSLFRNHHASAPVVPKTHDFHHSSHHLRRAANKAPRKDDVACVNPRLLLGMTITCWAVWGILVLAPLISKRWNVAVMGEGSEGRVILTSSVLLVACLLTYWTRVQRNGKSPQL